MDKMPKVYNYFDRPPSQSVEFKDASLTRQEFVKDADLNNIMARYSAGLPPASGSARPPMFGDFSNIPDYQTALQHVIDAQDRFNQLPSAVRKRFCNDPAQLLDFLADESNREEAQKLGLVNPPPPAPEPVVKKDVSVPPSSEGGAN